MDLWIRSQDKMSLAKFSQFDIDKNINDEWIINGSNGIWIANDFFDNKTIISVSELGIYKSKERALEVLDDINKFKDAIDIFKLLDVQLRIEKLKEMEEKRLSFTYQMPEE